MDDNKIKDNPDNLSNDEILTQDNGDDYSGDIGELTEEVFDDNGIDGDEEIDISSFWADDEDLQEWDAENNKADEDIKENMEEAIEETEEIKETIDENHDEAADLDPVPEEMQYKEVSIDDDDFEEEYEGDLFTQEANKEPEDLNKKTAKTAKILGTILGILSALLSPLGRLFKNKVKSGGRKLPLTKKGLIAVVLGVVLAAALGIFLIPKVLGGGEDVKDIANQSDDNKESAQMQSAQNSESQAEVEESTEENGEDIVITKKNTIMGVWVSADEKTAIHLMEDGTFEKKSSVPFVEEKETPKEEGVIKDINTVPTMGAYKIIGSDYIQFTGNEKFYRMDFKAEGEQIKLGGIVYENYDNIAFERIVVIPNFYKSNGKYRIYPERYLMGVVKNRNAKLNDMGFNGYVEISDFSGKSRIYLGDMKNGSLDGRGALYINNQPVFSGKFKMNTIVD